MNRRLLPIAPQNPTRLVPRYRSRYRGTSIARWLRLLALLTIVAQIGGGGSGASSQSDISFSISPEVSDEDASHVIEGITLARRYSASFGGGTSQDPLFVNARDTAYQSNPSVIGFSSPGFITLFTGSPGWHALSAQRRVQVVIHEYIHAVELSWLIDVQQPVPRWFVEGLSEYLSHDALASEGILKMQDAHDYYTWTVTRFVDVPRLEDLEPADAFYRTPGAYELAYLAVAHLVAGDSFEGLIRFLDEFESGADLEQAFRAAFGQDINAFYRSFAEARKDMRSPTSLPAAFMNAGAEPLESRVRIRSVTNGVERGEQLVVTARAEPNAACVFSLARERGVAVEVGATFADPAGQVFWLLTIPDDLDPGSATVAVDCGAEPDSADLEIR